MNKAKAITNALPSFPKELGTAIVKRITFLDALKDMGEEDWEIESEVGSTASDVSRTFFGWLYSRGIGGSIEVLAGMTEEFIKFIYLEHEGKRGKLSRLTQNQIREFITLCEFAVPKEEWAKEINPFDGLRLLFEFLDESGYSIGLQAKRRSLEKFKQSIVKFPVQENLTEGLSETH